LAAAAVPWSLRYTDLRRRVLHATDSISMESAVMNLTPECSPARLNPSLSPPGPANTSMTGIFFTLKANQSRVGMLPGYQNSERCPVYLCPVQSWASSEATRRTMASNRRRDTSIELALRRALHAKGLRYRVDYAPVNPRRRADIVFPARRLAVYLDGCFWHGCRDHYVAPKTNAVFWADKVERNRKRDSETDLELAGAGWRSLRIWEHTTLEEAVAVVQRALLLPLPS